MEKLNKKSVFSSQTLYWIVGFVDGEGCFMVSFTVKSSMPCGIETRPSFSISKKAHSLNALMEIKNYFNCGGIRFSKKDGTYKYEVRSLKDLQQTINPFFVKYELLTKKKSDFQTFKEICDLMKQGQHLNKIGLIKIITLAFSMNGSGKRKYSSNELLKIIDKLKI